MVNLVEMKPGAFEDDPNADDLWPFAKAVAENLSRINAALIASCPIGEMRLLPFRSTELPSQWYFMNGKTYLLTSDQGKALNSLPTNFKNDWGIAVSGSNINVPQFFHDDGRGYFVRAADGTARKIGSVEEDAAQAVKGIFPPSSMVQAPQQTLFQHRC